MPSFLYIILKLLVYYATEGEHTEAKVGDWFIFTQGLSFGITERAVMLDGSSMDIFTTNTMWYIYLFTSFITYLSLQWGCKAAYIVPLNSDLFLNHHMGLEMCNSLGLHQCGG